MLEKDLCFKIAGEAGQGINVSILSLARAFTHRGFYAFLLTENPNSIKLEHNWCSLRISAEPLSAQSHRVDILVALNKDALIRRQQEVVTGGYILYDSEVIVIEDKDKKAGVNYLTLPLDKITKELAVPLLLKNTIAIGACLGLVNYEVKVMEDILFEQFSRKGEQIVRQNNQALEAGYNYIKDNLKVKFDIELKPRDGTPKMFLSGHDALSAGAIKAGCKFLAAYPMTPGSSIMHFIAAKQKEYKIVVKHTEDEIAAINMAIGAGYAGVRAMTCTSGGGFCLMTEALGLAGQAETPLVVVVAQRPGPSTGQPTHTAQGDLKFAINASQGEFPRIVLAPGDINECLRETFQAFNLAEKFQVPVIILTDKFIAESYCTEDEISLNDLEIDRGRLLTQEELNSIKEYKRYAAGEDGVAPRVIPGMKGGMHVATSYEHDQSGFYLEDPAQVAAMMDKRQVKLKSIASALKPPVLYGPEDAGITIVSWGSNKGAILEAMKMLEYDGISVNFLHLIYLWPFPFEAVVRVINKANEVVAVEGNQTGQMVDLIREQTGLSITRSLRKYNGQPVYPQEIYEYLKEAR